MNLCKRLKYLSLLGLTTLTSSAISNIEFLGLQSAQAQTIVRNYEPRYQIQAKSNLSIIGNTLMTCDEANTNFIGERCSDVQSGNPAFSGDTNLAANNFFFMNYVDIDNDSTTFNSSSSQLTIPAGATVAWAGLYWSGDLTAGSQDSLTATPGQIYSAGQPAPNPSLSRQAKLQVPGSGYQTITADNIDESGNRYYSAYADVTSLIQNAGNGTYTMAEVQAGTGGDRYAGWSLVVVYEDPNESLRNVSVYDGFVFVNGSISTTLSGFETPQTNGFEVEFGAVTYEGDEAIIGDQFRLNNSDLSNGLNPANNFFNSSNTRLGSRFTAKNPNYLNELSIDIDTIDATGFLNPGDTSASLEFTTTGDVYFPSVFTFTTEIQQPILTKNFNKTVVDVNGGETVAGDILEYEITLENTGNETASNVVITDPVPENTTLVDGSLEIVQDPNVSNIGTKTSASGDDTAELNNTDVVFRVGNGADATNGGNLAPGESVTLKFQVQIDSQIDNTSNISNQASANYNNAETGTASSGVSDDPNTSQQDDATTIEVLESTSPTTSPPSSCPAGLGGVYATWSKDSGVNSGKGIFNSTSPNVASVPDFDWTATGDVASTAIDSSETFENNNQFEVVYGQADSASNLNTRVANPSSLAEEGAPITQSSTITLTFDSPTPSVGFGISIIDIESNQVRFRAKDANGNDVPVATIASWFKEAFDANPSDGDNTPSWDPAEAALIGDQSPTPVWQTTVVNGVGDNEAGAGWLQPDIPLSELTIEDQSLYRETGAGPSIHIYLASCLEQRDYSDAPADGGTAPDGSGTTGYGEASHAIVSGTRLGANIDTEVAAQNSANADGDDNDGTDDDDGITIPSLTPGQTATITADVSGTGGYLQGWIDWNGNGSFDTGEQIATDIQDNGAGDTDNTTDAISFEVTVPAGAITTADTFARFRWSTTSGLNTTTFAEDGEVEDYQVVISPSLTTTTCNGREIVELSFTNPTLEPDTAADLQVGAVYRFSNVTSGIDALVEIEQFNGGASLIEIDAAGGTANALQPTLNPNGLDSSVDFIVSWVISGTDTPTSIFAFNASGIDIDGDGGGLREYVQLNNFSSYVLETPTELIDTYDSATATGRFESRTVATQPGIDITATTNIATAEYSDVSSFRYSIGAEDTASSTTNRLNSLNFECVNFNNPQQNAIASDPNLILVKRITAINPGQEDEVLFNTFVDDGTADNEDNDPNWPDSDDTYLPGAIRVDNIQPGDEVEYTIYFLSNGDSNANSVQVCDVIPDNMSFVSNGFDNDFGIALLNSSAAGATAINLSNAEDADEGAFYLADTALPTITVGDPPETRDLCQKVDSTGTAVGVNAGNNVNGAVIVELDTIPKANNPGDPVDSYGFIRFRAKVQ